MKFFCSIFVVFVVILTVTAESDDLTSEASICRKETNASDKDLEELLLGAEPTTKEGKCLYACLMTNAGLLDENSQLVADKMLPFFHNSIKDKANDVIQMCQDISDPDRCEAATKIILCLQSEVQNLDS